MILIETKDTPINIYELEQKGNDSQVRFSFSKCELKKDYCLSKLHRSIIKKLFKKMWESELLTVKQFKEKAYSQWGFWKITKWSSTDKMKIIAPWLKIFWHMRITWITEYPTFRLFLGRRNETFYVLCVDHDWKIDYKSHK